jgi:hypothetical protein
MSAKSSKHSRTPITTRKSAGVYKSSPPGRKTGYSEIWLDPKLGHEAIVANVRELRAISHSDRKSDQVDAEKLARYARLYPNHGGRRSLDLDQRATPGARQQTFGSFPQPVPDLFFRQFKGAGEGAENCRAVF